MEDEKKFEEVNENLDEDIEGLEDEQFNDAVGKMKDAFNDVKDGIAKTVADLKTRLSTVDLSKEKVQGYLDEFSKAVNDVIESVGKTYKEVRENPKTVEYLNKAKETYEKVAGSVKESVTNAYNKARENDKVRETTDKFKATTDKVSDNVKNATETFAEKYHEFTHDPKVRETVVGAVNAVSGVYNKAVDAVKEALAPKEEVKEEESKEE